MKKRKGVLVTLLQLIIPIGLYLVFYSRIESKPNDAGFWLILVIGMSIGVALARLIQLSKEKGKA